MNGFTIFDSVHLTWLIAISLFFIISLYFYRFFSYKQQLLFQKTIFWLLLFLELAKQVYLVSTNQYSYWSPPLHLCGLGIFIIGWHAYFPDRTSATLLFTLTLPGAAIALIFPGWTNDVVGGFLHVHSFVFHTLLIVFVFVLVSQRQLQTDFKDCWRAVVFLALTVPIIYAYNAAFNTNFMFLNMPVKHTPLQWLYDTFGASGYLVSLAVVIFSIWIVLYLL
ncbi:YwaF family protein [Solibacillus sp. MA9]|uniref:YwaF family protein n=1 Tax=Solibacillus palustris TaxID=2908203 RepID=A0ABS9UI51_9BACL|nr:YwaF family protein [Solibacillus sp. MA9]MCH7324034.1 YwaF family protein [Solibacillus sp. MA9]